LPALRQLANVSSDYTARVRGESPPRPAARSSPRPPRPARVGRRVQPDAAGRDALGYSTILLTSMDNPTGWCEHCGGAFHYRLIHNGFGDSAYAYCDACAYTVLLDGWSEAAKRVHFRVQQRMTPDVERLLKLCPCGGAFRASADPKCPHCSRPLSAVVATSYIEKNAPGTAKGWRWDQSWAGVYSIAINEKIVKEWWDEEVVERLFPAER